MRWRSLLYVPVTSERFVEKAHTRGADAIILDLEDAVAGGEKERARTLVADAAAHVGQEGADVLVRINRPWRLAVRDVEAVVGPGIRGLFLPKVESSEHVVALAEVVGEVEAERGVEPGGTVFVVRVEHPRGLLRVGEIAAAHSRVVGIGLGSSDYTTATGMTSAGEGNTIAAFQVVNAAVAAGILPLGLVGSIGDFSDLDHFRQVCERSRDLGFRGTPCLHPTQVTIVNEVFSPTPAEIETARRIVDEYERAVADGQGAIMVDGAFIDVPYYEQARRLLERSGS